MVWWVGCGCVVSGGVVGVDAGPGLSSTNTFQDGVDTWAGGRGEEGCWLPRHHTSPRRLQHSARPPETSASVLLLSKMMMIVTILLLQ